VYTQSVNAYTQSVKCLYTIVSADNSLSERIVACLVAVCCSVLQCVAVCCSVLQCVAVCCSVLQCASQRQWWTRGNCVLGGYIGGYRVAKTHRMPYLYRSFSAKVTYI